MNIIGLDPGITGGIAILKDGESIVFKMPTKIIEKNGKNKKDYDVVQIASIIKKHSNRETIVFQELTHALPGNGSVSSYFFGRGAGILEGVCTAMGLPITFVTPQQWKKTFVGLIIPRPSKEEIGKMTKKQIAKLKRVNKAIAKTRARELASSMYPELAEQLRFVNADGLAEALLIASHAKNQFQE